MMKKEDALRDAFAGLSLVDYMGYLNQEEKMSLYKKHMVDAAMDLGVVITEKEAEDYAKKQLALIEDGADVMSRNYVMKMQGKEQQMADLLDAVDNFGFMYMINDGEKAEYLAKKIIEIAKSRGDELNHEDVIAYVSQELKRQKSVIDKMQESNQLFR